MVVGYKFFYQQLVPTGHLDFNPKNKPEVFSEFPVFEEFLANLAEESKHQLPYSFRLTYFLVGSLL